MFFKVMKIKQRNYKNGPDFTVKNLNAICKVLSLFVNIRLQTPQYLSMIIRKLIFNHSTYLIIICEKIFHKNILHRYHAFWE